jgi:ankyrin repeat protein
MVASWNADHAVARLLVDRGAGIDLKNQLGNTALMHAAESSGSVVKLLLDRGADIRKKNKNGLRAIHFAIEEGNPQGLAVLIDHGESPDGTMPDGRTYDEACALKPDCLAVLQSRRNVIAIERVINQNRELGRKKRPGFGRTSRKKPA